MYSAQTVMIVLVEPLWVGRCAAMPNPPPDADMEALAAALYMARCRDSRLTPNRAALTRFQAQVCGEHKSDSLQQACIRMRNLGIGPRGGAVLSRFLVSPIELDLHGNSSLGDAGGHALLTLLDAGTLRKLDLGACGLGAAFSPAFARHMLQNPDSGAQLTHLELGGASSNSVMKPNTLRQVPALMLVLQQHFKHLSQLGLSHNTLGEAADALQTVYAVAALATKSVHLSTLDLSFNGFGDKLHPLLQVLPLTSLTELDISGNGLGDAGATCLAAALSVTSQGQVTEVLNNTMSAIAAEGIARQARHKRRAQKETGFLCNLAVLRLSHNHIQEAGAKALGQALHSVHVLKALFLQDNLLGDDGVRCECCHMPLPSGR